MPKADDKIKDLKKLYADMEALRAQIQALEIELSGTVEILPGKLTLALDPSGGRIVLSTQILTVDAAKALADYVKANF